MLLKLIRHRLVKDTIILFGVQVSGYLLPLITLPYITAYWPTNFGLTAIGTALVLYFAVVTDYGFAVTGTRRIAISYGDPLSVSRIYSTVMFCKLCLLAFCFVSLGAILTFVPAFAFNGVISGQLSPVVGLGLSPNWFLQVCSGCATSLTRLRRQDSFVILIFALVHRSSDYVTVATLQSGGFLVSACIGLLVVFTKLRPRLVMPFGRCPLVYDRRLAGLSFNRLDDRRVLD